MAFAQPRCCFWPSASWWAVTNSGEVEQMLWCAWPILLSLLLPMPISWWVGRSSFQSTVSALKCFSEPAATFGCINQLMGNQNPDTMDAPKQLACPSIVFGHANQLMKQWQGSTNTPKYFGCQRQEWAQSTGMCGGALPMASVWAPEVKGSWCNYIGCIHLMAPLVSAKQKALLQSTCLSVHV